MIELPLSVLQTHTTSMEKCRGAPPLGGSGPSICVHRGFVMGGWGGDRAQREVT